MSHVIRGWSLRSVTVLIVASMCATLTGADSGTLRVHLRHGKIMEATRCTVDGVTAHVSLVEGGSISFPASLVDRVETVPEEVAPVLPEQPPVMNPVVPIPAVESQPVEETKTGELSIESLIQAAARRHNLEPDLLAAVIAVESGYNPSAVSPKGARGLMQLMPGTAKDLSVTNPFDPEQNIEAGARYLRQLLDQHGGSFVDALAAYNAGGGRVARYNGVPPYRETIAYINRVLTRYRSPKAIPAPTVSSRSGR